MLFFIPSPFPPIPGNSQAITTPDVNIYLKMYLHRVIIQQKWTLIFCPDSSSLGIGYKACKMTPNINFWLVWQVKGMKKDSRGMKRKNIYVVLITNTTQLSSNCEIHSNIFANREDNKRESWNVEIHFNQKA